MSLRIATPLALVLLATGCATSYQTLIEAGPYQTPAAMAVTLERPWTEMAAKASGTGHPYLTLDGPRLNQVHVIRGIPEGEGLLARNENRPDVPTYRRGMTDLELVDFLTDSVASFGFQNVVANQILPSTIAGLPGARLEFSAAKSSGLRMKGLGIAAETTDGLDVLLFFAPEVHYYGASIDEVERMFASAARTQ